MTQPGLVTAIPEPKPIRRISPSRFHSLKECALREAWAGDNPGPLPTNPIARLGSIAHLILEEVGSGQIDNEPAIAARWDALVQEAQKAIEHEWLERHLVPFNRSVADYDVRRLRCIKHAAALLRTASRGNREVASFSQPQETQFEIWVQTPGGEVGGRIDYVYREPTGLVIRDYKTGVITTEESETDIVQVKIEYQTQLMLYAALFEASIGEWPRYVEIVPLIGVPIRLDVHPDECKAVLTEALEVLKRVNATVGEVKNTGISAMLALVKPTPETCQYCPFRPWCPFYENTRNQDDKLHHWPRDVIGICKQVVLLGNGTSAVNIQEANRTETTWVRGLNSNKLRHPALGLITAGNRVGLFNLGAGAGGSFTEAPYTIIYRLDIDQLT